MLKKHAIFYSLFITLSVAYYFIDLREPSKNQEIQSSNVMVPPVKIVKAQPVWKYQEYEGNKIASLQSNNAVNILIENPEIKVTYLFIEHIKFVDNNEESYIKITKAKGRHPCWDEEQYCHLNINGKEFKLQKGENFQEMKIEDSKSFMDIVKNNTNIKIITSMTIQPSVKEAFVEDRVFYFSPEGFKE